MGENHRDIVLFVCTGNTCRSPMAEALAIDAFLREPDRAGGLRVASAGVSAGPGAPPTPEAIRAVEALGASMPRRASRPVTPDLLAQARVIYCMTREHLRRIAQLVPEAAERARLLDPEGEDVPDPIGADQARYDETARRLQSMVRRRLKELTP